MNEELAKRAEALAALHPGLGAEFANLGSDDRRRRVVRKRLAEHDCDAPALQRRPSPEELAAGVAENAAPHAVDVGRDDRRVRRPFRDDFQAALEWQHDPSAGNASL